MGIDIKKLIKENKDPEYVISCLNLLTPLEKSIILVLHTKKAALNIKQIQNEIILNLIYFLQRWGQGWSEAGSEMDQKLKDKVKILPYYDFTPSDIDRIEHNIKTDEMEGTKPGLKGQKQKGVWFDCLDTSQEGLNHYKKRLTEMEISYPSFEKIQTDLKELQKMDLVMKRETYDKKSKGLWAASPLISFYLKKTKSSLYNEKFDPNKNDDEYDGL